MKNKLSKATRTILVLCGLGLIAVLFVPLWAIDLVAPQYPEGLVLIINPDGLAGNVDIINGLNHYIGMRELHNDDFVEFTVLPYIIGTFAALFFIVAAVGKKRLLNILVGLYILFGVVSMVDFWKWEYDYGHDLDPHAAIKVPGMAYQPPLIGYKQLLNFSAYSVPATGGWIFIGVGAFALGCAVFEFRRRKRPVAEVPGRVAIASAFFLFTLNSCSTEAEPIRFGQDNCYGCKMTITDTRFGAELVTKKGKVYKFDDTHCILEYMRSNAVKKTDIAKTYLVDFSGSGNLIDAEKAHLYHTEEIRSPMGGNVAAFSSEESLRAVSAKHKGTATSWKELAK